MKVPFYALEDSNSFEQEKTMNPSQWNEIKLHNSSDVQDESINKNNNEQQSSSSSYTYYSSWSSLTESESTKVDVTTNKSRVTILLEGRGGINNKLKKRAKRKQMIKEKNNRKSNSKTCNLRFEQHSNSLNQNVETNKYTSKVIHQIEKNINLKPNKLTYSRPTTKK